MQLQQTTTISGGDSAAKQELATALKEEDVLLVVVLGNDEKAEQAVEAADVRAEVTIQGFDRKVLWVQEKSVFTDVFSEDADISAGDSDFTVEGIDSIVAVSISKDKVIKDVVKDTDTIDFFRMETAFLEAGTTNDE
jgi:hypothetical protein